MDKKGKTPGIRNYETPQGVRWKWYWTEYIGKGPDGAWRKVQHTKKGYLTKREAEAGLRESKTKHDKGHRTNPETGVLVSQYLENWLTNKVRLEPASRRSYRIHLDRVNPHLGYLKVREVAESHISHLIRELRKPGSNRRSGGVLSEASIQRTITVLKQAFKAAVVQGYLASNPCDKVERSKEEQIPIDYWNEQELTQFLNNRRLAADPLLPLWELLAATGLRRAEALGLKWRNVDLEAGRILVLERRVMVGGVMETRARTKNHKARTISVGPATVAMLKRHKEAQEFARALSTDWEDSGLVFVDKRGRGIHAHRVEDGWKKAVRESGLLYMKLHGLRHCHCSILLRAGVNPKLVQERLGHHDPAYTMRVYGHLIPGEQEQAVAVWERQMSASYLPTKALD